MSPAERARVNGFSRYVIGGILMINLVAVVAGLYLLDRTQRGEEEKFRIEAATLAHLIMQDVEREFTGVDLSLRVIVDSQWSQHASDRGQLAAWLERVRRWHPALSGLRISDAEGNVVSLPTDAGRILSSVAQHDYFVRLRDDPEAGLQITLPVTNDNSGRTVIDFARRLADPGGRFAGIAVASLPVAHFAEMFAQLELGPGVRVSLFDSRHGWILRYPAQGGGAVGGRDTLAEPLRQALRTVPDDGFFDAVSDGVYRRVAYRHGREFDLYVVLDQPSDGYLGQLGEMVLAVAVVLALFALLTAAFGLMLNRNWKQQASLMAQLLERDLWIRQAEQVGELGMYSIDIDADSWTATEAFDRMTGIAAGYPRTSEGWLALIHPDDRDAVSDSFRRAAAARREVAELECRIIRACDGEVRWISSVAQRVPSAYGSRHAIVGVAHDITVRKCVDDQLRRSEQLFRGVVDTSLIGIVVTSPDRRLLAVNQAACDMFGRTRDEVLGMDWLEVSHPDDCSANLEALRRVIAGQTDTYELEKRYVRKDGTIIDAYIAARALRCQDGTIEHIVTVLQDVTARKRAERMLRQSEADLRAAIVGAAVGIAFVAPNGAWLSVNDRLCEIVGYPRSELLGLSFQAITYPDDLPRDLAQVARMLAREIDRYSLEKRYVRKNGDVIWANLAVSLVFNEDGTPHHFVSIVEDIDARKRTERELRRSRELLQSFLDHLPGLAYIKDASLRMVHANEQFRKLLHLDPADLIGRASGDIFPGGFGDELSAEDRRVLDSGQAEVIDHELNRRIYQTTKFVIPQDEGPPLLGGIALDVTRRRQLEQRAKSLLEISEKGGTLPEKEFLAHGLEAVERLTGSTMGFLHFVDDDQQTIELSTWSAGALEACAAAWEGSHCAVRQAGIWSDCLRQQRAVTVNDYADYPVKHDLPEGHSPLHRLISVPVIEEGKARILIGVGNKPTDYDEFDVMTVQLIGNDLWRIVHRLRVEQALARRLDEVTQLKDKVEQAHVQLLQAEKMSAIGQLAAGVAHELNNPIGFVSSNLFMLSHYVDDLLAVGAAYRRIEPLVAAAGGALDEVHRLKMESDYDYLVEDLPKLLRESLDGLERVRGIIIDLKDFSRVGEVDWQWADLRRGLDTTLNIVANEIKYKAEVQRQYGDLPEIRCLPSQLNQVFMNLLVNAAQAIEGHGTIIVRTGTEGADGGQAAAVWVEIEDSGHGMPPEVQRRLFEPFFTTKPVGRGTGLGLSISFGIVEKHHGRIDCRSAPGCGTTFRVTLPIDGSQYTVVSSP